MSTLFGLTDLVLLGVSVLCSALCVFVMGVEIVEELARRRASRRRR